MLYLEYVDFTDQWINKTTHSAHDEWWNEYDQSESSISQDKLESSIIHEKIKDEL